MIDNIPIEHHIQKHIIGVLMHHKVARFRDMRPPQTDSNLYSYHLGSLLKNKMVEKTDGGYTLTKKGIAYIDRVSTATLDVRLQPKIITMFVVQNSEGQVLLVRRQRHPFIGTWSLPNGKVHSTDASVMESARREAREKLGVVNQSMTHAGECYIRTLHDGEVVMSTLAHIWKFNSDEIASSENMGWVKPHRLNEMELAPAVENIVARTFFNDPYFFEEYEENW